MILSEDDYSELTQGFDVLSQHARPVRRMRRALVGRDHELLSLRASLARAELCNVILLGDAGSGKTSLVQGAAAQDADNAWVEVDLASMIAGLRNPDEIGDLMKRLFREASELGHKLSRDKDARARGVVLFMDEFHQVVELSPAAVEALKPALADSGTRGVRLVAATTLAEFRKWVMPNQPLMERLQRLDLPELGHDATVDVLRDMAVTYDVASDVTDPSLYDSIYEYSERFVPSSAQPRKSLMILDSMVGWHRTTGEALDQRLLARVIEETTGNRVELSIDASKIKEELDKRVLAQDYATRAVEQRLQLCVADLNDPTRPRASFLLTGSTGTGKDIADYEMVPVWTKDGSVSWKRHGDLVAGDMVFGRHGQPERVEATFPHDDVEMYRMTLTDGRTLDLGEGHLLAVYTNKMRDQVQNHGRSDIGPRVMSVREVIGAGVTCEKKDRKPSPRFYIPMNEAVEWPEADLPVDPYVIGALIGNGCLTKDALTLSSDDVECAYEVARLIGASGLYKDPGSHSWRFVRGDAWPDVNGRKCVYTDELLAGVPGLVGARSRERRIPEAYMTASVPQRWALVQGLFDTDGSVSADDRRRVSCSTFSEGLARDVQRLLWSLGVSARVTEHVRVRRATDGTDRVLDEWCVRAACAASVKPRFFRLPRKRSLAEGAAEIERSRTRVKKFDMVGIASLESIGRQHAQCIYVDDPEHLYQAGPFVVTHNTELVKQVSKLLFGDDRRHLIRLDMTEFSRPDSVDRFRRSLCAAVWERPFSVLLLDEIEKACGEVTRVLLQVLDDGRLTDENGRVVPFVNCYVFMTTNAGSEIYRTIAQYESSDTGDGAFVGHYDRLIRDALTAQGGNRFPPELLGRIDCIIPFQPLSENTMERICKMKLKDLRDLLWKKHGVRVEFSGKVLTYLVRELSNTDSNSGGARQVVARITTEISCAVARFVNENPDIKDVGVKIDGTMASEDKRLLEGDARVRVVGIKA